MTPTVLPNRLLIINFAESLTDSERDAGGARFTNVAYFEHHFGAEEEAINGYVDLVMSDAARESAEIRFVVVILPDRYENLKFTLKVLIRVCWVVGVCTRRNFLDMVI